MIHRKIIRRKAFELLESACGLGPSVDVRALAVFSGVKVVEEPIEKDDFSGFLFRPKDGPPVIGVKARHAVTRKRFTIAHELGHFILHSTEEVHVDEAVLQMRDSRASEGVYVKEIEANFFAAELLMPQDFLERDVARLDLHADDDKAIALLAKRYVVSPQAMAIRLSSLELFLI
ncbi:MAG: ImmA/IrrE family metallo-endopeptidase [Chthoniobacteraceae bacterium]